MMLLLSGEGPGDIGTCRDVPPPCGGDRFQPGPMAIIVDRLSESQTGYSLLENFVHFVSETEVARRSKRLSAPRSPRLPGAKSKKETVYFRKNAKALAQIALEQEKDQDIPVVAVLFRDADGSNTSTRGMWRDKFESMEKGFADAEYERGVPMIPNPKSEAWLICALKEQPYQPCGNLEKESGNDASPNSLKGQLEQIIGSPPNSDELVYWVQSGRIDPKRIDMPSFCDFRKVFERAVKNALARPRSAGEPQ